MKKVLALIMILILSLTNISIAKELASDLNAFPPSFFEEKPENSRWIGDRYLRIPNDRSFNDPEGKIEYSFDGEAWVVLKEGSGIYEGMPRFTDMQIEKTPFGYIGRDGASRGGAQLAKQGIFVSGKDFYIFDENFDLILKSSFEEGVNFLGFSDGKYYVLLSDDRVLSSVDGVEWDEREDLTEVPLDNGSAIINRELQIWKGNSRANDILKISRHISDNISKEIIYELTIPQGVIVFNGFFVGRNFRGDICNLAVSKDGVYWYEIPVNEDGRTFSFECYHKTIKRTHSPFARTFDFDAIKQAVESELIGIPMYVEINNKLLGFDIPPIIESERALVPLRFIFETLGAEVEWDNNTKTAIVQNSENSIAFSIDNQTATVNGTAKTMEVPARLIDNKTLVPLRFLSEELGYTVAWDEATRIATISQ